MGDLADKHVQELLYRDADNKYKLEASDNITFRQEAKNRREKEGKRETKREK